MEIRRQDGMLLIEELGNGLRKLTAVRAASGGYRARNSCITTYPTEMIEAFLNRVGIASVCEVIGRDGDEETASIFDLTSSYYDPAELVGKRLLDFGCGGGASTVVLAKLFPRSEVVGVELVEEKLQMARARSAHHRLENVQFKASPDGCHLPPGLGTFDFVYLFAVYEHLLPAERTTVLKLIWSHLNPGGIVFIEATPHRYFPVDLHSTYLPLINYMPDRMAHWTARTFAKGGDINKSPVCEDHLRGGLRGATEREILKCLRANSEDRPMLLEPSRRGLQDRCDYWFSRLNPQHHARVKKALKITLKIIYSLTGTVLTPNLSLAIQKPRFSKVPERPTSD